MAWWHRVGVSLSRLLGGAREERQLDEEIRFHLDMEARRQRRRGMTAERARREAHARFGDVDRVRQHARDARPTPYVEEGMHDVRLALRALVRARGFSILALLTLALGIGATTVAFTVVDGVLLKPLPFDDPERLVMIHEVRDDGVLMAASFPNFIDWRAQARGFSGIASFRFASGQSVRAGGEPVRVQVLGVSEGYLRVLGVRPWIGREFSVEENRPGGPSVAMVSYEFWQTRLGAERDLARIDLQGSGGPVQVVGVLPPHHTLGGTAELFVPHEQQPVTMRSGHNYRIIGRLAPGVPFETAQSDLSALARRMKGEFGDATQAVDARIVGLRDQLVGQHARLLTLLLSAAALVLLIACANLVSAQLARGAARSREFAVRAALGAGRGRLVRQLGIEALILAIGGAALGVVLSLLLLRGIRTVAAGMLPRLHDVHLDLRVLAFTAAVTILAAVLTGVIPGLRIGSASLASLRSRGTASGFDGRSPVWHVLAGVEIALAVLLLIGAGLLVRTLQSILTLDPGFDPRGVMTVAFSPDSASLELFERVEAAAASVPGVLDAAVINQLPFVWGSTAGPVLRPEDVPPAFPAYAGFRIVSANYFDTMRMPVLRGRAFGPGDRAAAPQVAILTQPLAERLWPGEDPIGKPVRTNYLSTMWLTVVGVVPEARHWGEDPGEQNEIYVPMSQHADRAISTAYLVLRTDREQDALVATVRSRLREAAPTLPFAFGSMEQRIADSARDRRFAVSLLAGFALVALLLAGLGIHGIVTYGVNVRTREFGVRIALGATGWRVLRGVLGGTAAVAGVGIAAGIAAGLVATRALQSLLFGVSRLDPLTFVGGAAVLFVVALGAAMVPAWRSSRVDPMVAMRSE